MARYLRLLGFDVWYENCYSDDEIIRLALQQQRIILTRDVGLLKHKAVTHGYWLRDLSPKNQVKEIIQRFDLKNSVKPFSRCMVCNGLIQAVPKEHIMQKIPSKTKLFYQDFYQCLQCHKIYWPGAHFQKMQALVAELTSDLS